MAALCPLLLLLPPASEAAQKLRWRKYDNCSLIPNEWNDGDSFHVKANGRERIFRLYFVDCPEIEDTFPDRVDSQADHFRITPRRSMEVGRLARSYVIHRLSGRTFTVWTRGEDADGESRMKRSYALIFLDGEDIGAALVENGLARVYGKITELPDGRSGKVYRKLLDVLEQAARKHRRGGWLTSGL